MTCSRSLFLFLSIWVYSKSASGSEVDTYDYAGINVAKALKPSFYKVFQSGAQLGEDAHPVHGIETSDGGFLLVGQSWEVEGGTNRDMFAIKTDKAGTAQWSWRSKWANNDDAALFSVQLAGGGDLIIGGFRKVGGAYHRALAKLTLAGKEVWVATFDDTASSQGVIEVMNVVTTSGSEGLICGGAKNMAAGVGAAAFKFKSAGKIDTSSATAFVMKLPLTALTSNTAPTASSISWIKTYAGYRSAHSVKSIASSGDVVALFFGVDSNDKYQYMLMRYKKDGTVTGPMTTSAFQVPVASDMLLASDGTGVIAAGYKVTVKSTGDTYVGAIAKWDMNGALQWTKEFGGGGTPELMYNECWGVAENKDGYVIGCGWGIEACDNSKLSADLKTKCNAGKGDDRTGAVAFKAAQWRSLIVQTDKSGKVLWQRVDKHKTSSSSASEYVVAMSNGGIMSVNDEVNGAGLLVLAPAGATGATTTTKKASGTGASTTKAGGQVSAATTAGTPTASASAFLFSPLGASVSAVLALLQYNIA
eukprot:TRINITY_DN7593_c0_g1_i3.p1 TRINITY_DN7593_c0_g1~~TRINITY_DN7593_c0_g1_i3.p1  ORF type:complete len:532 (+),score=95.15 TRINITY_DN7593_c0_g1_i3:80-1675(+)